MIINYYFFIIIIIIIIIIIYYLLLYINFIINYGVLFFYNIFNMFNFIFLFLNIII